MRRGPERRGARSVDDAAFGGGRPGCARRDAERGAGARGAHLVSLHPARIGDQRVDSGRLRRRSRGCDRYVGRQRAEPRRQGREAVRGHRLTAALHGVPVGTRFGFTVNEATGVTLTFRKLVPGRRVHRRCRALTHRDRHDPRCTRTVTRGAIHVHMKAAGRRTLRFTGRIGSRHLAAGRYTVTVHATGRAARRPAACTSPWRSSLGWGLESFHQQRRAW
jgi:hypothetical protein